jgi:hypothetical protein
MRIWACAGLAVASLILGGCTTSSSAPNASLAVTLPRCPSYFDFGVSSFAKDRAPGPLGAPSPVAAARSLANDGLQPRIPRSGWHEEGQSRNGATVVSGNTSLHVIQLSDGSWTVDSGKTCS